MDNEMRLKKRGQVTIFIIVAIVIVVGIFAIVLLSRNASVEPEVENDPRILVRSCVEDAVKNSVDKIIMNGGEILPSQSIMYQSEEWNYLCYQADFYQGCYNIHPMLEMQIEEEIVKDTQLDIQECFNVMRVEFEELGFEISGGATSYSVDLLPGYLDISLDKRVDISRGEASQSFEDFGFEIISPIYDLVRTARNIVNDESQYCNFEYNGYMLLYPKFDIRRVDYRDSKLYRIIDRKSNSELRFAVRSCAFAPGI